MNIPGQPPPIPSTPPAVPAQVLPAPAPRKGSLLWLWIVLGTLAVIVVIVALLVGMTAPLVMKQVKKGYVIEAISNAKQIGLALHEFEGEYGALPNRETAVKVAGGTETSLSFSEDSSNAFFRQLLAAGLGNERMFYSKAAARRPDGIADGVHALGKGECGFAYITGLGSATDGSAPLVVAPLIPGTKYFDPGPFGGEAIILRFDGSATLLPISSNGEVLAPDGRNILDPGHPHWGGASISIAYPE